MSSRVAVPQCWHRPPSRAATLILTHWGTWRVCVGGFQAGQTHARPAGAFAYLVEDRRDDDGPEPERGADAHGGARHAQHRQHDQHDQQARYVFVPAHAESPFLLAVFYPAVGVHDPTPFLALVHK